MSFDMEQHAPVIVNPQNANDEYAPEAIKQAVLDQGMERIGGVLVPAEIAHAKPIPVSKKKCASCMRGGSIRRSRTHDGLLQVTMCEVRQHNTLADCWITSKGSVYDASQFMREDTHPGGERAFMRRAGGIVDCAEDLAFHSAKGRKMWLRYRIAVLVGCGDEGETDSDSGCIIS